MITVQLKGGMGNQMFQYAAARALSLKRGTRLVLDITYLLERFPLKNFVYRDYDLDIFSIDERFTVLSRLRRKFKLWLVFPGLSLAISKLKSIFGLQKYLSEPRLDLKFRPKLLEAPDPAYLAGYWQSYRYFEQIADIIRSDFTFKSRPTGKVEDLLALISSLDSVCVNVRRGDFVSNPKSYHAVTGEDFYLRAIPLIKQKVGAPHLFVFSDEVEWCREHLRFDLPTTYVGHEFAGPKFVDYLRLMIACKHFIIPNSTFAWWAAWLSQSPDKTVIVPEKWFRDLSISTNDLVPQDWIRLK